MRVFPDANVLFSAARSAGTLSTQVRGVAVHSPKSLAEALGLLEERP